MKQSFPGRSSVGRSALVWLVVLAGCNLTPPVNREVPPPGPVGMQEGYRDGCIAGFVDAGRDGYQGYYAPEPPFLPRYAVDAEYRGGWENGRAACFAEQHIAPRSLGLPSR